MYKNGLTIFLKHVGQYMIYDIMTDCMDKLDRFIDQRICEMLHSNATDETPAKATYF